MSSSSKTPLQWAEAYRKLGAFPLPLKFGTKSYAKADISKLRLEPHELPQHFNGAQLNVGLALGSDAGHLAQVDYDHPAAAAGAGLLLPVSWSVDRAGAGLRRTFYRSEGAKQFEARDPLTQKMLVELKTAGCPYVPPSVIEGSGTSWRKGCNPFEGVELCVLPSNLLEQRVCWLAAVAVLAAHWPKMAGNHHDIVNALTGALCRGCGADDAELIGTALATLVGMLKVDADEVREKARTFAAVSTCVKFREGGVVTGFAELAGTLERLKLQPLLAALRGWLPLQQGTDDLIERIRAAAPAQQVPLEDTSTTTARVPFPLDALGPVLSGAARDLARLQQTDGAFAAGVILGAAAASAQAMADVVRPGSRSSAPATLPLALLLLILGLTGERKTTTANEGMDGAQQWQDRAMSQFRTAMLQYRAQVAEVKERRANGEHVDDPVRPRFPQLVYADTTFQALLRGLHAGWPSAVLYLSEAGLMLGGHSMSEQRLLTVAGLSALWDGKPYVLNRVSEGEVLYLKQRRLSALLLTQPEVGKGLFADKLAQAQGLLSRVLPMFPDSTIGTRMLNPEQLQQVDTPALDAFNRRCDELLILSQGRVDMVTGELNLPLLSLEADAVRVWVDVVNRYERGLAAGGEFEGMNEYVNKAAEQVLRLAGIRAVFEEARSGAELPKITAEQVSGAAEMMDYFTAEWMALAGKLRAADPSVQLPVRLIGWMREKCAGKPVTVREIGKSCNCRPIRRMRAEDVRKMLQQLIQLGHVQLLADGKFLALPEVPDAE